MEKSQEVFSKDKQQLNPAEVTVGGVTLTGKRLDWCGRSIMFEPTLKDQAEKELGSSFTRDHVADWMTAIRTHDGEASRGALRVVGCLYKGDRQEVEEAGIFTLLKEKTLAAKNWEDFRAVVDCASSFDARDVLKQPLEQIALTPGTTPEVLQMASLFLTKIADRESLPALVKLTESFNPYVRRNAYDAFARIGGGEESAGLLVGRAGEEITVFDMARSSARAQMFTEDPKEQERLTKMAGALEKDRGSDLRVSAIMAVGATKSKRALPFLRRLVKEQMLPEVAQRAIDLINEIEIAGQDQTGETSGIGAVESKQGAVPVQNADRQGLNTEAPSVNLETGKRRSFQELLRATWERILSGLSREERAETEKIIAFYAGLPANEQDLTAYYDGSPEGKMALESEMADVFDRKAREALRQQCLKAQTDPKLKARIQKSLARTEKEWQKKQKEGGQQNGGLTLDGVRMMNLFDDITV